MLVDAEFLLPVAGYGLKTLGSPRHAVRNDPDVPHYQPPLIARSSDLSTSAAGQANVA